MTICDCYRPPFRRIQPPSACPRAEIRPACPWQSLPDVSFRSGKSLLHPLTVGAEP